MSAISRRSLLAAGLVAAIAPRLSSAEPAPLRVGYIPILPMAQLFVLEGEGWAKQAGLNLQLVSFSSGPAMVQALASGTLDVAYIGIGPAMVARTRGVPLKIVAANIVDQVALVGRGSLAAGFDSAAPGESFRKFREREGRPAKIATLPPGSVPEIVLRYWLREVAKVPAELVEIVGVGEDQVQQLLLAGAADGASIVEPIQTIVKQRDPAARTLAATGTMWPGQPGAIVAATEAALAARRDEIAKLVGLHLRATGFIRREPEKVAGHLAQFLGKGLIEPAVLRAALAAEMTHFVADPRIIVAATMAMQQFQLQTGSLTKAVPAAELFDFTLFDAVR